jgi:uncharacterized membrane protein YbhN (UPF0104 family)
MTQDNALASASIGLLVSIAGALIALTTQDNVAFFIALMSAGIGLLVSIAGALIARKEQAKRIAAHRDKWRDQAKRLALSAGRPADINPKERISQ